MLFAGHAGAESWDGISSQAGGSSDRGSDGQASTLTTGRRGMFAALRIEDLGVIGEKGTKVCTVLCHAACSCVRCVACCVRGHCKVQVCREESRPPEHHDNTLAWLLAQVPNVTVAEINIELEFQMTFALEYDASANVWGAPRKAKARVVRDHLQTSQSLYHMCCRLPHLRSSAYLSMRTSRCWKSPHRRLSSQVEMVHLDRTVRGNNVPLPRTLLR